MAAISYLEKDQAGPQARPVLEQLEKGFGALPNIFKAMAHSPGLLGAFVSFFGALLEQSKLDPKLRELAYIKTSALNECHY